MVTGLNSAAADAYSIRVSPRNAPTAAGLARSFPNVSVASGNQEVLDQSETVVVAVRPQITEAVLAQLRFRPDHKVISVVSGFSVQKVSGLVAPATKVTRAVPLPSAARRRSPTAVYPRDAETVELFAQLGAAFAVDSELQFGALCTVTATMATYFAFADTAATWLEGQGIAPRDARDYIARIYAGLAETASEANARGFQTLAADHATRGGTNEQVLQYMSSHGAFDRYREALDGILRRVTASAAPRDAS